MPHFASHLKPNHRAISLLRRRRLSPPQLRQIQSNLTVSGAFRDPSLVGEFCAHFALHDLSHAQSLLRLASHPSVSTSNTVIRALSENHQPENALLLCRQMPEIHVSPDNYTFSFVLRACSEISDVVLVSMYHVLAMKSGWDGYDYVRNGLIHSYGSCKSVDSARKVFDQSPNRDVVSWTAVINGYLKVGELGFAREMFDKMPNRNAVAWSSMINGYARMGMFVEALETFDDMMIAGTRPNPSGLVGALSACAHLGALAQGKWIHAYIDRHNIHLDGVLGTALIDLYAKCGCLGVARDVFERMPACDVFAYTSIISGLADHGESVAALEIFRRMENEGVRPNEVTVLCALCACSRMGLVKEGLEIFERMRDVYGVEPGTKHYGCLVDLLGRAGLVEEAKEVVRRMPVDPDPYVMGALLNARRVHGDMEVRGDGLDGAFLDHSGLQVLVSNVYASVDKWDEVEKVRTGMGEKRIGKMVGCSSVDVDQILEEPIG